MTRAAGREGCRVCPRTAPRSREALLHAAVASARCCGHRHSRADLGVAASLLGAWPAVIAARREHSSVNAAERGRPLPSASRSTGLQPCPLCTPGVQSPRVEDLSVKIKQQSQSGVQDTAACSSKGLTNPAQTRGRTETYLAPAQGTVVLQTDTKTELTGWGSYS